MPSMLEMGEHEMDNLVYCGVVPGYRIFDVTPLKQIKQKGSSNNQGTKD